MTTREALDRYEAHPTQEHRLCLLKCMALDAGEIRRLRAQILALVFENERLRIMTTSIEWAANK